MSIIVTILTACVISATITTIFNCATIHDLRLEKEELKDDNEKLKEELDSAIKIKKAVLNLNDCYRQKIVELEKGESDDKDSEKCDTEE